MQRDDDAYRHILSRSAAAPLATHYELLGVAQGESDRAALEQAMLDCVIKVRRYQVGAYQQQALELLNALGEAYVCLTDEETRREYERSLGIGRTSSYGGSATAEAHGPAADATPWPVAATDLPKATPRAPSWPAIPADETPVEALSPTAAVCPQCGKPMSARLTTCYHCNYRRGPAAAAPAGQDEGRATMQFSADDLVRQDITPEQLLARFHLMRDMYQAKKLARKYWVSTQPNLCQRCNHKLASSNDAHAIPSAVLSTLSEFVVQFARRQQSLGKHFDWPLSQSAIEELQEEIVGRKHQSVRLYCRNCSEKLFRSPRLG
jgi:hypothetical protein